MSKVIYQTEIQQCRQCPNCYISPDPDSEDWFEDDNEKAHCRAIKDENGLSRFIEGDLRPYEEIPIPNWCPLIKY